jgi:adenosylhomocysteinase
MLETGELKVPAINVNDSVTKSKCDNKYGCRHSLNDAVKRATDHLLSGKKAVVVGYGDVGKGSAQSLRQEGMIVKITEIDPICAMQACLDGFEVVSIYNEGDVSKGANKELLSNTDMLVTSTGNYNVCDSEVLSSLKSGCVVCNIGHFDNEIDTPFMRENWEWDEIKPQVHKIYRDQEKNDHLLLLAEGRLVNLGNATGHPSRIMDGSFANQVLAQIELFKREFANQNTETQNEMLKVEVLPKNLDEEVAQYMVEGFGGVMTRLTKEQADYIGVEKEGPFKPEYYRY